jgi:hypothetical protein
VGCVNEPSGTGATRLSCTLAELPASGGGWTCRFKEISATVIRATKLASTPLDPNKANDAAELSKEPTPSGTPTATATPTATPTTTPTVTATPGGPQVQFTSSVVAPGDPVTASVDPGSDASRLCVVFNDTWEANEAFDAQGVACVTIPVQTGGTYMVWRSAEPGNFDLLSLRPAGLRGAGFEIVAGDDLGPAPGLRVVDGVPAPRGWLVLPCVLLLTLWRRPAGWSGRPGEQRERT